MPTGSGSPSTRFQRVAMAASRCGSSRRKRSPLGPKRRAIASAFCFGMSTSLVAYSRSVVTVISPHLAAAGAAWDDGPEAGGWIADRLGPFGPAVGHAVPLGYPACAVVPLPTDDGYHSSIDALLDVLEPFTGDQPVHCGMWEGWGWWYDTGADPRTADGMSVVVSWPEGEAAQEEIDRALAEAREELAAERVECPDVEPLDLPARRYYLWTGPLRSATAFRHQPDEPPSLIWPEDRSWFVGVPIYTNEIAVAGATAVVDAVVADPRLGARRATPDDVLDIDD
jgi:hypothetical protein